MSSSKPARVNAKRRLFESKDEDAAPQQSAASLVEDEGKRASNASASTARIVGTPQKKQRLDHSFFSPKKRGAIVTPEKEEAEVSSPVKAKRPRVINLTEDDDEILKSKPPKETYIPTYIHKNVSYQRKGVASLPPVTKKAFALVEEHYVIPEDLEQNRSYGPLSGSCFEERAIKAYNLSLLEAKETDVEICSHCATVGHKRNDCPDLI